VCRAETSTAIRFNPNNGTVNNGACLGSVGIEPVNFAFITRNGLPHPGGPPSPVNSTLVDFYARSEHDLFMNSGDVLIVDLRDTAHGLQIVIMT